MKDFQEMMRDKGYGYSYENDKYIFFSCDNSTVINSQRIDDKVLQCFENKMNIYLSRIKWQSQTIDDFIEKLKKVVVVLVRLPERQYLKWEVIFL